MFGIGGFELFIILLFGFLIFGPDKLPEMAKTLGAALRKFKQAQAEMESVIKGEVLDVDGSQAKKSSSAASSASAKAKPAPTATQESFAERKARYDKERAERKAREEQESIAANRRAIKEEAAKNAREAVKIASETQASETRVSGTNVSANQSSAKQASETRTPAQPSFKAPVSKPTPGAKPSLTPEELFGVKPIQNKPAPKSAQVTSAQTKSVQAASAQAAASERGE